MLSRSNDIKSLSCNDANEVVDELFESLCLRYQENLETSMRESDFIFDLVQMMHVNFRCGGSFIDSLD